jgi:hypothetical protein
MKRAYSADLVLPETDLFSGRLAQPLLSAETHGERRQSRLPALVYDKQAFSDRLPGIPAILACRKHTVFRHPQNYPCSRFTPRLLTLFDGPVGKVVFLDRARLLNLPGRFLPKSITARKVGHSCKQVF